MEVGDGEDLLTHLALAVDFNHTKGVGWQEMGHSLGKFGKDFLREMSVFV